MIWIAALGVSAIIVFMFFLYQWCIDLEQKYYILELSHNCLKEEFNRANQQRIT